MCEPISTAALFYAALGTAAAGTAATVYQGEKARSSQNKANDQAKMAAQKTAADAARANNKANQKKPDTAALLAANALAATGGQGSTMLTGPMGIDPSALTLGKSTLLGGG
jgi:Na+(H+)/acetate symporter ActP